MKVNNVVKVKFFYIDDAHHSRIRVIKVRNKNNGVLDFGSILEWDLSTIDVCFRPRCPFHLNIVRLRTGWTERPVILFQDWTEKTKSTFNQLSRLCYSICPWPLSLTIQEAWFLKVTVCVPLISIYEFL